MAGMYSKQNKTSKEAVTMESAGHSESDSLQRKRTTDLTDERMLLLASEAEGEPGIQLMYRLCKGTRAGITALDGGYA